MYINTPLIRVCWKLKSLKMLSVFLSRHRNITKHFQTFLPKPCTQNLRKEKNWVRDLQIKRYLCAKIAIINFFV